MRLGVEWYGISQSRCGQTVHNISHIPAFKNHISPQNHAKYETIFNYGLFNDAVSCSYTKRRMVRRLAKNERKRIGKEYARNFPARSLKNHENLRILDVLTEFQTADLQNTREVRCSVLLRSE
jgi:hypothetical protein